MTLDQIRDQLTVRLRFLDKELQTAEVKAELLKNRKIAVQDLLEALFENERKMGSFINNWKDRHIMNERELHNFIIRMTEAL